MSTRSKAVLFTDMEGSTEFSRVHGDADAVALLRVHESAVRASLALHRGVLIKNTGDGFLAVFPTSTDGVAGALGIRARLAAYNVEHPDRPLRVRLGVHTGPVIEEQGDVFGVTVSTAARIASKAHNGQVLVSEQVVGDASGDHGWTFVDRGLFWLKGFHEQWRLHEVADDVVPADGTPLAPAQQLPLVDRDVERAVLRRAVDGANGGHGGLVLVTGSAGSGKTRLVDEVGAEAVARGMQFLVGRCHETSQADPYAPLVEIAEAVERRYTAGDFREILGGSAPEVARLLPHLRERYADIAMPFEATGAQVRRYFFMSVRDVFARLAARRPLVLLLDDLQWADAPTLLFVEHLASELAALPILVIGTYTSEAVSTATPLHATLARLHQRRSVETVSVGPLARQDAAQLLASAAGRAAPDSLVRAVHELTEGNAFFASELVRQIVEQRGGVDRPWGGPEEVEVALPESVRLVIETRLARLGPTAQRILTVASLFGRRFGFEVLEALDEATEDELLDAVDDAERAHLLVSSNEGGAIRFEFAHELIRRALAGSLSHARRQRLHLQIADALAEVHADALAAHAAEIVYHLLEAGSSASPARTLRFVMMAGDRALDAAAFEDAVRYFDQALELLPAGDTAARGSVLERLATAERSLGLLDVALARWDAAVEAFEAAGDAVAVARVCLDAAVQVAWWRRTRDVSRLVDRGLAALGDRSSPLRAGLLAVSGMSASQTGDWARGEELLDDARVVAKGFDDDRVTGLTLYASAAHHFAYQEFRETVDLGLESVDHLRRAGDLWNLANIFGYVGASLGWLGRFDEAAEIGAQGEDLAVRLGNWSAFVFAEQAQAFRAVGRDPSPTALEARGRRALELGDELGFSWLASIGHTRIGLASFWRGRWDDALAHFDQAARLEVRGAAGGHLGRLLLVNAYLGNRAETRTLVDHARADFPVLGRPNTGTSWGLAASAVEALAMIGEREDAAALYDTLTEMAATGIVMRAWDFRLLETLEGIAAGCAGEWDRAERHFAGALEASRVLPSVLEEPDVHRFRAAMLLTRGGRGDRATAVDLLDRAVRGYEAFGMAGHAAAARALVP